jgi:immunity protein 10 of polymorphic toxin system
LAGRNLEGNAVIARIGYIEDPESNFEAIAFLDEGSGESFEIQRSLIVSDQDRRLGMDTYCLVRSSGPTFYGGIEEWSVSASVVSFLVTGVASEVLGLPRELVFEAEPDELALASTCIDQILG